MIRTFFITLSKANKFVLISLTQIFPFPIS